MNTPQQDNIRRAIRGMYYRNWLTLRWGLMPLIVIWFLLIWIFGYFQGEVLMAAMFMTLVGVICSAIGGFDQLTGEGEYQNALPPTRKQRYWIHFLPGFTIVLGLTLATFLTYAWSLPQLLWGSLAGGDIAIPYHTATWAEYGLLLICPLYAFCVSHTILMNAPSIQPDPGIGVLLRIKFLFVPSVSAWGVFVWCSLLEQRLWPHLFGFDPFGSDQVVLGIIVLPVFAILTPLLLWRGRHTQRNRETTHLDDVRLLGLNAALFVSTLVITTSGVWGVRALQENRTDASSARSSEWGLVEFSPPTALCWLAIVIILAVGPAAVAASWRYFNGSWKIPPFASRKKRLVLIATSAATLVCLGFGVIIAERAALNDYMNRAKMTVLVPKDASLPHLNTEEIPHWDYEMSEWTPVSMNILAYSQEDNKPLWGKTIVIDSPGEQKHEFEIGGTKCVLQFDVIGAGWRKVRYGQSENIEFILVSNNILLEYKARHSRGNSSSGGGRVSRWDVTAPYNEGGSLTNLSIAPSRQDSATIDFKAEVFPNEEDVEFIEAPIAERIAAILEQEKTRNDPINEAVDAMDERMRARRMRSKREMRGSWFGAILPVGFLLLAAVAMLCISQRHRPFLVMFFISWIILAPIAAHHYVVRVNEHRIATSDDPIVRAYAERAIESSLFTDRAEDE